MNQQEIYTKMEVKYDTDGEPYVMWGGHKLRLEKYPLTDKKDIEKAKKELRESPEIVPAALVELRKLLNGMCNLDARLETILSMSKVHLTMFEMEILRF